jgi:hypothetical protein
MAFTFQITMISSKKQTNVSHIQVGEMKGANQTELETQINLMVYTAYPRKLFFVQYICPSEN